MFDSDKPKKKHTPKEAKLKAANFCAYQERSQQEVRDKLYDLGLHYDDVEEVLSELITEDFINEERFAKAFIGGKFRLKKWGRNKILHALQYHKLSPYCIKKGMTEINDRDYLSALRSIIDKKTNTINLDDYKERTKIARYAISRGYEPELVWQTIKNML